MKYIRYIICVLLGLLIGIDLHAQPAASLKICEVLVINENNFSEDYLDVGKRIDHFKQNDRLGIGMAITAMGVVFLGLIGLYLLFNLIGSTAVSLTRKRVMKTFGMSKEEAKDITKRSGEVYAAIAMAIYEATELHDEENTILTIKNTVRNYSPWSSKIYALRKIPER